MLAGVNSRQPGAIPLAAFSGEPGAFAEDAVHAYFGPASTTLAVGGFRDVFEAVAAERAAMMMVDEAHATGVFGPSGSGLVRQHGLEALEAFWRRLQELAALVKRPGFLHA